MIRSAILVAAIALLGAAPVSVTIDAGEV